ncbi:MAG: A/G-specific adenine glycosylase [Prevotella sp.]|jgi:A/G-specific adenine glycosylase|nr:A/G-specific adenine glycosylase [Prevotella sp.]
MNNLIIDHPARFGHALSNWYNQNKRTLPWRDVCDPYIIWISEIILQQTRVEQGYGYFLRFTERFPDVASLSNADEEEVLKLWQGLGYYSRARNLHAAAKDIMQRFGGVFPQKRDDVLSLKGIGEYTAAAIVSFAYNQPFAVVDGNVFRVLSRLFAIDEPIDTGKGKKFFGLLAQDILDKQRPGLHNQAMMELGALQCVPANPDCSACPLQDMCLACASGNVQQYPVKQGKTQVKNRYFNYLDIRQGGNTYINKREKNDVWKNMYEFPLIETPKKLPPEGLLTNERFVELFGSIEKLPLKLVSQVKHLLSHRIIYASFYRLDFPAGTWKNRDFLEIPVERLRDYPVSRLIHKYMEEYVETGS